MDFRFSGKFPQLIYDEFPFDPKEVYHFEVNLKSYFVSTLLVFEKLKVCFPL